MSRIEQLISEIEEYIDSCKFQALSNSKIIVNKEEMEELLVELRMRIPDEIKKYQKIISQHLVKCYGLACACAQSFYLNDIAFCYLVLLSACCNNRVHKKAPPMFITRQLRCFFAKSFTSLCGILKYNSTRLFKCQGHF